MCLDAPIWVQTQGLEVFISKFNSNIVLLKGRFPSMENVLFLRYG